MRADEVPAGWSPSTCLRCGDVLAFPPGIALAERQEACAEHHLWMCANPTPNAARLRARARGQG